MKKWWKNEIIIIIIIVKWWKNEKQIKMKWMKNKLKSRLIQYNWKFEDLIKLWII
jgi:hypothetical protein